MATNRLYFGPWLISAYLLVWLEATEAPEVVVVSGGLFADFVLVSFVLISCYVFAFDICLLTITSPNFF